MTIHASFVRATSIAAVLAIVLPAAAALADHPDGGFRKPGHGGPPSPEQRVLKMSEALDLTSDQVASLLDIFRTAHADVESLSRESLEATRPEICAIFQATRDQVATVLSEAQFEELETLRAQREESGRHRPRHPESMCEDLDASS